MKKTFVILYLLNKPTPQDGVHLHSSSNYSITFFFINNASHCVCLLHLLNLLFTFDHANLYILYKNL